MRNVIRTLLLVLFFSSCQDEEKDNVIYYPSQREFSKTEYQYLDLDSFSDFNRLVDSLVILKDHSKKAAFKIEADNVEYHVLASTMFDNISPQMILFKNILSIGNDSIRKKEIYPISELKQHLKKDLYNKGRDNNFADSPEKLVVSVTSDMDELENLLIKIFRTFQEIEKESSDSLQLNIQLNQRMEIFPPPPPLED